MPLLTGNPIAATYRTLNHIEECFRMMKSNLGLSPMYVRPAEHIKAHVDICVPALLLMRIIRKKVQDARQRLSPVRISKSLGHEGDGIEKQHRIADISFCRPGCSYRREREKMSTKEILQLLKSSALNDQTGKTVLTACGIIPVPRISSRSELGKALSTRFPTDQNALPELIDACL